MKNSSSATKSSELVKVQYRTQGRGWIGYRGKAPIGMMIAKLPQQGVQYHVSDMYERPDTIMDWNRRQRAKQLKTIPTGGV